MIFSNVLLAAVSAMTVSALPHVQVRGTPTSSASSTPSSTSSSGGGGGSVQIVNNLDTKVNLWSTAEGGSDKHELSSGGGSYSESFQTTASGGISIKLSTSDSESSVLQFEYKTDGDKLYWDMSSIDLDSSSEFIKNGFTATPSDSSCKSVSCSAGDTDCSSSYQQPDDVNTNSCSTSSSVTLTLG
ncbi:hypothetical protein BDV25DRAFT_82850 [Aspergillus avenaceus]|uniref:GPI anchored cell wall protein n=1 Tax=Aspergillus avenaceus TaxID=36643 RepID=A0A5N6U9P2_ASPAV|nr:hypothetical protein BDV25DRAFT_82850 [Aspergillus avenaceus]